MTGAAAPPPGPGLQVYLSAGCAGCGTARRLVEQVRRLRPDQRVEIIDIDTAPPPPEVIGTPTYRLDGRVIFLGNPALDSLLSVLDLTTRT